MTPCTDDTGTEEERTRHWLDVLRGSSDPDKIEARRGLAGVFEQRGMLEEAVELLERNVDAGVRDAETLRWLSRLYQARDDRAGSPEAVAQAPPHEPVPHGAGPPGVATAQAQSKRSGAFHGPIAYLLVLVGLGIAIGAGLWMLAPLPGP